jgi:UDPglucose 6-dehydrogenase
MTMTISPKAPIVVVGAGHVGLVTAIGFAAKREVRLVDKKIELIEGLRRDEPSIFEPDLDQRLRAVRDRMSFYVDIDQALDESVQLVFVAVGTPPEEPPPSTAGELPTIGDDGDGDRARPANLEFVEGAIDSLLGRRGLAAVMKSTVPPGTGDSMLQRARERDSDLIYLSCPEFLQEGRAFQTFDHPDRIVVGAEEDSWATAALLELHAELHPGLLDEDGHPPYIQIDIRSAETVKYAANLGLAASISYTNQVGNFCEEIGADVSAVMRGVGADHRIGPEFLDAGPGFGGSCFKKDLLAFSSASESAKSEHSFADTVLAINKTQPKRIVQKLLRRLETLQDARVAILGLAFKADTDDLRESPALALIRQLRKQGATVCAWDPMPNAREQWGARGEGEVADSAVDAMADAEAVVVVTEWPEFRDIDWPDAAELLCGKLVVDGRNCLDEDAVRAAGLEYEGTGRASRGLHRPLPEGAAEG